MEDARAEIIVKDVAELFKVLTRWKGEVDLFQKNC